MGSCSKRAEAIESRRLKMVDGVLSWTDIESVAICQEGLSSLFLDFINDCLRPVWSKEGKVPKFSEMEFYSCIVIFEIYGIETSFTDKLQ